MLHRLAVSAVALALALPAPALGQSDPFSPLAPPQPAPQPAPAPTGGDSDTNPGEDKLEPWQELALVLGGGVILVGIGYLIVRDARRRRPITDSRDMRLANEKRDPHRPQRKQQRRQAAKRARAARRKNR